MATHTESRFSTSKRETASVVYTTERVKELESQVSELKKRLEDLRKAKSQTIVKKDKEYISSGALQGGARQHSVPCTCKEKIQEKDKEIDTLKSQVSQLKTAHAKEMEVLKNRMENNVDFVKELQDQNESLKLQNKDQQLQIEDFTEQLSKKEAEWCEKEEKLKVELKQSWGERYQQWMAQTEQKIEELQSVNNYLKTLLKKESPHTDGNNN